MRSWRELWLMVAAGVGAIFAVAVAFGQTPTNPSWVINQARCAIAVTPSDTSDLPPPTGACVNAPTKGIYTSGTSGAAACTLSMALLDGAQQTWGNVQPGSVLPVQARRVYAADQGTTCSGILALY